MRSDLFFKQKEARIGYKKPRYEITKPAAFDTVFLYPTCQLPLFLSVSHTFTVAGRPGGSVGNLDTF